VLLLKKYVSINQIDQCSSSTKTPVSNNTGKFTVQLLETGVLVLLLHCKFSCIVGDRSFSAAAAL
jgi:hypothetical protein